MRLLTPPGVFQPPSDAWLLADALGNRAAGADVLDVCCGSGVLGIAAGLAGARSITAVDVSRRAVATAWLNGRLNGVRVSARRGDLLSPVADQRFDLIVSNPPYLPAAHPSRRPRGLARATEAGRDGRSILDRLLEQAPGYLRPGGSLLVVHSSINGVEPSLQRLQRAGLQASVVERRRGGLGPILRARAGLLEQRGLLGPGEREEEVVIVGGEMQR